MECIGSSFHGAKVVPTLACQVREVEEVAQGSYKRKQPPEIVNSGYVIRSLEAALWAFYHTENFKDGCLQVGEGCLNEK